MKRGADDNNGSEEKCVGRNELNRRFSRNKVANVNGECCAENEGRIQPIVLLRHGECVVPNSRTQARNLNSTKYERAAEQNH